jgi:hypothetical protein
MKLILANAAGGTVLFILALLQSLMMSGAPFLGEPVIEGIVGGLIPVVCAILGTICYTWVLTRKTT